MNRLTHLVFPLLFPLLILMKTPAKAQQASADSLLVKALATDELLPMLIDSAIKYSAELRRIGSSGDYAKANLEINKKAIYNAVSLLSSYNYGTNFSAVNNQASAGGGSNFTAAQTGYYNVGVGIQLPITHLLNRKNIIKAGQSLVNMTVAERDNAALLIKQDVIRLYQDFKLSHRLMAISGKNKQAAQVNNSMAEKDFLNAQLTVEQESRVMDIYNKSVIEYETNVNRFQTSYMQLEAYTGTNLSTLIMQIK